MTKIEPAYKLGKKLFINGERITKKAAKEKCQQLLKTQEELNGEDLIFVGSILMSWYEDYIEPIKIKVGLASDGKWNCFYYLRHSGDWEDFSYIRALDSQVSNLKKDLQDAFRYEISDQILDYKGQYNMIGNRENHVDHVVPFQKLLLDFLKENNLQWQDIELQEIEKDTIEFKLHRYQIKDRKLAKAWQDYHRENAKLQMLPAAENIKKSSFYNNEKIYGF